MSGLWRDHPATPRQQSLFNVTRKRRTKITQADVLIAMLREARMQHRALELTAIMHAGIAQHGARLSEIRALGFEVENQLEHVDGAIRSRYILRFDPESEAR